MQHCRDSEIPKEGGDVEEEEESTTKSKYFITINYHYIDRAREVGGKTI